MLYHRCIMVLLFRLTGGCAVTPAPDLQRLYETRPLTRATAVETGVVETPVILMHGVFGSRLRDRHTGIATATFPWTTRLCCANRTTA